MVQGERSRSVAWCHSREPSVVRGVRDQVDQRHERGGGPCTEGPPSRTAPKRQQENAPVGPVVAEMRRLHQPALQESRRRRPVSSRGSTRLRRSPLAILVPQVVPAPRLEDEQGRSARHVGPVVEICETSSRCRGAPDEGRPSRKPMMLPAAVVICCGTFEPAKVAVDRRRQDRPAASGFARGSSRRGSEDMSERLNASAAQGGRLSKLSFSRASPSSLERRVAPFTYAAWCLS